MRITEKFTIFVPMFRMKKLKISLIALIAFRTILCNGTSFECSRGLLFMKEIQLSQGKVALVDDQYYESINKFKWYAKKGFSTYYAARNISIGNKRELIWMHRTIIGLKKEDKRVIDHINHNGLDNRKENIRIATRGQNSANKRASGTSKYLGVYLKKKVYKHNEVYYWIAQIASNKKKIAIGYFPFTIEGEIQAAKAYDEAAKIYHKEFANLNFK